MTSLPDNYCPHCSRPLLSTPREIAPVYCAYCGQRLVELSKKEALSSTPTSIAQYKILKNIGKGGMGEVFLAFDPICKREVALKRLKPDFWKKSALEKRFLHEARITASLAHPSIIPIYAIHVASDALYFTMPHVHGQTLREMIRKAYHQERSQEAAPSSSTAIPAFMRIFLAVCQAVAYAHAKGVVHRDLKPENVIVGAFGQVVILDWGLATLISSATKQEKLMGTVPYLAPEQARDVPASPVTDIFALGVILYQILTLHMPFHRTTMKEFRLHAHKERLIPPEEVAPYRDVPQDLSSIVKKCLEPHPEQRYQSASELVLDLEKHLEGRSEWLLASELDLHDPKDWELRDHVLTTEQMAITQSPERTQWAIVMLSRESFPGNVKVEMRLRMGPKSHGIGVLINVPEAPDRVSVTDGYCCWMGTHSRSPTRLFLSNVELLHLPQIALPRETWCTLRLEKSGHHLHCYVDNILKFSYLHYQPVMGTHVGLLCRDSDFELESFLVYTGGDTLTVSCLAVPDAFFAARDYTRALSEYRRLARAFPGTAEGREALFRAGLTLLEDGKASRSLTSKEALFQKSLEEFEKLQRTPGAPLGWLGKSLVYRQQKDTEEEVKCVELALRRYSHHPMRSLLGEQVAYRLHEGSHSDRLVTYHFALLALQYLPKALEGHHTRTLLESLHKHWEPLYFIESFHHPSQELDDKHLAIVIAFWLAKPYALADLLDTLRSCERLPAITLAANAIHALIVLGMKDLAEEKLVALQGASWWHEQPLFAEHAALLRLSLGSPKGAIEALALREMAPTVRAFLRALFFAMEGALDAGDFATVREGYAVAQRHPLSAKDRWLADSYLIWAYLLEGDDQKAGALLEGYSLQLLSQETSLLHPLYGCWVAANEGEDLALLHFAGTLEVPYPRTWALLSHWLLGKMAPSSTWKEQSFLWERRQLYRQLHLFHHCLDDADEAAKFQLLARQESL